MALSPQSLLLVSPVLIGDGCSVLWSRVVCLTNSAESLGVAQVSGMALHHFFSLGQNHPCLAGLLHRICLWLRH